MIETERLIQACDPPLADTLRLMMPCANTMLLLQAALLEGDAVNAAWSQWRRTVADPKVFLASDRVGIKRHLPLLYRNLVTWNVEVGRDLEPYFRAARAREELRSARYRRFLLEALVALQRSGVEFMVGKGVTIGETVHADPVVRHSHDIDLLVRSAELSSAAAALEEAGFAAHREHHAHGERRFDHESGLPVELHDRLYRTPFYDGDLAGPWSRARSGEILGIPVRLIGYADLLVHALVHATVVPQRRGLSWITDVVTLLQQRASAGTEIDWGTVTRIGEDARAALPLYVTCQFLAATFNAPIPPGVIDQLRCQAAAKAGRLGHLVALDGLRSEPRLRPLKLLVNASGWRSRAAIAWAIMLPPLAYLRAHHPKTNNPALMLMYIARPLRFIARHVKRLRYRLQQRWLIVRPIAAPGLTLASVPPRHPTDTAITAGRTMP